MYFIPYSRLNTTYKLESSKVVDTVDMEDLGRTDELFLIIAMILIGIDAGLPEPVIFDFAGSGSYSYSYSYSPYSYSYSYSYP